MKPIHPVPAAMPGKSLHTLLLPLPLTMTIAIAVMFLALADGGRAQPAPVVPAAAELAWPDWFKPETKYIIRDFAQQRRLTPLALARAASNATWIDVGLVPWAGDDWSNSPYQILDPSGTFRGRVNVRFKTSFLEQVSVRGVAVVTVDFLKRGTSLAPSSFDLQRNVQLQLFALRLLFDRPVDPGADSVPVPAMNSLLLLDAPHPSASSGGRLSPGRVWNETDATSGTQIRHHSEFAGYSDAGGERTLNLDVHLTRCGALTLTTLRNNVPAPNQVVQVRGPNGEIYPDAASGRDPWIFSPGSFRVSTNGRDWTGVQVVDGVNTPVNLVVK